MSAAPKFEEQLLGELSSMKDLATKSKADLEAQYRDLKAHYDGVKADNDDLKKKVEERAKEYAAVAALAQAAQDSADQVKRILDTSPVTGSNKDLADQDRAAAIELQRRVHMHKHGPDVDFKADLTNLVNIENLRSAARKMMAVGPITQADAMRKFNAEEKRAFEASGMSDGFFDPQVLGYIKDCNYLPASMLDLYGVLNVDRSTYKFLNIKDYSQIGAYDCDAKCDAELGPSGNMVWLEGKTYDFRGAFCLQKKTVQEANVDLLGMMFYTASRSHFINRNRASVVGDGINEPPGWLTAKNGFQSKKTHVAGAYNHVDFRHFASTFPVEFMKPMAVMHQNVFGYLASMVNANGNFLFGDGMMMFTPDDVQERIRICNWLPDATAGGTKGSTATPFTAGDFLCAVANWEDAYKTVNKRPMFMEQYLGGSSAWCVKYQFGAEDGGQIGCVNHGQIQVVA